MTSIPLGNERPFQGLALQKGSEVSEWLTNHSHSPGEPSSGKPALDAKDSTKGSGNLPDGSGNLPDGSGRYCLSFELGCSRKTLTPTIPRFTSETKVSVSGWHYWRAHDNSPQIWGNHVHGSMKLQRSFQQIIYIYMDFC